jgi:hypothetical protein
VQYSVDVRLPAYIQGFESKPNSRHPDSTDEAFVSRQDYVYVFMLLLEASRFLRRLAAPRRGVKLISTTGMSVESVVQRRTASMRRYDANA